jgi:hypothetical protein
LPFRISPVPNFPLPRVVVLRHRTPAPHQRSIFCWWAVGISRPTDCRHAHSSRLYSTGRTSGNVQIPSPRARAPSRRCGTGRRAGGGFFTFGACICWDPPQKGTSVTSHGFTAGYVILDGYRLLPFWGGCIGWDAPQKGSIDRTQQHPGFQWRGGLSQGPETMNPSP